jgi:MFS family permease
VLTSTVIIPPIGRLTDMFGRKPFILAGVVLFVLASAACGWAPLSALIRQQPDGDALLAQTLTAQRAGAADGIDNIFTGTTIAAALILVGCLTLKEITLRRSFDAPPPSPLQAAHGADTPATVEAAMP